MTAATSKGGAAFGRERRLLAKPDFDRVFQAGRRAFLRGLVVYVHDSPTGVARIGLVTSRKFGNAVRRNRARRLLRDAFRRAGGAAGLIAGLDVVALPQPGAFPDHADAVRAVLIEAVAPRGALDGASASARRPQAMNTRCQR